MNTQWVPWAVAAVFCSSWEPPAVSDRDSPLHVRYTITNLSGAPDHVVDAATFEIERTFAHAGVRLTRGRDRAPKSPESRGGPRTPELVAFLVGETTASRVAPDQSAVGFTVTSSPHEPPVAMVAFDRAVALADAFGVTHPRMLASILAHEFGHLLLPRDGHGRVGVMKASWTAADLRRLAAAPPVLGSREGGMIRTRLERAAMTARPCYASNGKAPRVE